MGLRVWKGDHVAQADVDIAKNYLAGSEIKEHNRLTVILLDIFEDQLDLGKINTMAKIEALLDNQLRSLSRQVLPGGGSVKRRKPEPMRWNSIGRSMRGERQSATPKRTPNLAALKAQEKLLPKQSRQRRKPT
jgi:hypothetical protein